MGRNAASLSRLFVGAFVLLQKRCKEELVLGHLWPCAPSYACCYPELALIFAAAFYLKGSFSIKTWRLLLCSELLKHPRQFDHWKRGRNKRLCGIAAGGEIILALMLAARSSDNEKQRGKGKYFHPHTLDSPCDIRGDIYLVKILTFCCAL